MYVSGQTQFDHYSVTFRAKCYVWKTTTGQLTEHVCREKPI